MTVLRGSQKSLILIARQYGIHIGPNDIPDKFKIEDKELSSEEMCKLASSFEMKAKQAIINEKELANLLLKKQQILKLKNGRYIIAMRIFNNQAKEKILLFLDVGNPNPKPQQIIIDELKKAWLGEIILLKPKLKIFEETSEFSISWLIGEAFQDTTKLG